MVDCWDVVQSSARRRGCSSLRPETFSPLKEKEPGPRIRLLSRLCLETRSSKFLAQRRCLSCACFPVFFFFFFSFPSSVLFLLHRGDKVPLQTVSIMFAVRFNIIVKTRLDKDSFVAKITIELLRLIRIKKVSLKNAAYVLYRLREKPRNNVEHERFFQSIRRRITFFSRKLVFAIRNYRSLGLVRNIRERERD